MPNRWIAAIALVGAMCPFATRGADSPALSGHVDVVSQYVLRGATTTYGTVPTRNAGADAPESSRPALQWGADATWENGFFLGYWASSINYSYKQLGRSYTQRDITNFQSARSIENDVYGGYNGTFRGFGYTLGLTGYAYVNGQHANALETKLGVGWGPVNLNAQTLLRDTVWGNRGDTYWTLNYATKLPHDLSVNASFGYYTYHKQGRYLGNVDTLNNTACAVGQSFVVNGCYDGGSPIGGGFRHFNLGLSQPIGKTGLTWGLTGILAGKTRFGFRQADRLVGSLSYGF